MSIFKKLQEKKQAERIRKSEMMQGFTMQAELSATIVTVKMLGGDAEKTNFLVEPTSQSLTIWTLKLESILELIRTELSITTLSQRKELVSVSTMT